MTIPAGRSSRRRLLFVAAALGASVTAYALLTQLSAASYAVAEEAESVSPTGNARLSTNTAASGGSAVIFGSSGDGGGGSGCASPSDNRLRDQMEPNQVTKLWRKISPELVLYFDIKALPTEYADYARQGAASWSRSECIDARVTTACPSGSICIPITMSSQDKGSVVGSTIISSNNTYAVSARIEIYSRLNNNPPDKRRMTMIHEIGHACRLGHRSASTAIMYTPSRGENSILPDSTDMHNLRVLYGPTASRTQAEDYGPITETVENFY